MLIILHNFHHVNMEIIYATKRQFSTQMNSSQKQFDFHLP